MFARPPATYRTFLSDLPSPGESAQLDINDNPLDLQAGQSQWPETDQVLTFDDGSDTDTPLARSPFSRSSERIRD
jgi:hypothetical protein